MGVPTRVKGRFARSVRLGSSEASALDGYLPTARALDVVRRVLRGMRAPDGSRAFSITGPYGSGKSSLAVFLDALCSEDDSALFAQSRNLLRENDPDTEAILAQARATFGAGSSGFARAIVTAPQREPVAATVLRALQNACADLPQSDGLSQCVDAALARALDRKLATPSYQEIRQLVQDMASIRPVLIVIDEFGKNLEAYSSSGADGDMYLLQELAEWATDAGNGMPLIVVTIQHLAFETYAASASSAQRREWAKVQGRFEDIPYADSASATRNLIASALDHGSSVEFDQSRRLAAKHAASGAAEAGLPEVTSEELLAACWPLHPSTLLALPELCARYGQNERTLFSFLASAEPLSVTSWLERAQQSSELGWVRLDRVYDYFVESAGNFLAASADAGRWTEVATAIRDASGLTASQRRVLKTVGVLNLVAASGMLRASADLVGFAAADGDVGTSNQAEVQARLTELRDMSLVTYRDYAHEYRIWRGSDFDINRALGAARRTMRTRSLAELLGEIRPMPPVVASRHSTTTGTVRAFKRIYADTGSARIEVPGPSSVCDGLLVHRLDPAPIETSGDQAVPVVTIDPRDLAPAIAASIELGALLEVSSDPGLARDDTAARRELAERIAYARVSLDHAMSLAFNEDASWTWLNPPDQAPRELGSGVATSRLSRVLDEAYSAGPSVVAYEAINRAELTSAGARARRIVMEAIVDPTCHKKQQLGLVGDGAEVAMYRAVIADAGVHDSRRGTLQEPTDHGWKRVWEAANNELRSVSDAVNAQHLLEAMMAPPFGLREGTASLLATALLVVESPNIAIYEHGTFVPRITAPLVERLVRNPKNFAIKHIGTTRRGGRWQYMRALNHALDDRGLGEPPSAVTLLSIVQRIADTYRQAHSRYALKTRHFHGPEQPSPDDARNTAAVRQAITDAREPDILLFELLPAALGHEHIDAGPQKIDQDDLDALVESIGDSLVIFKDANEQLALEVFDRVVEATVPLGADGKRLSRSAAMRALEASAATIATVRTVPQNVRAFIQACLMNPSTPQELGTQVATTVTGTSPRDWDDNTAQRNLAELQATARSFRRIADLAKARASYATGDRSFDAYSVTITSADGNTLDRTVTLTSQQQKLVSAAVHTALDMLRTLGSDPVEALLAGTAAYTLTDKHTSESNDDEGEGGQAHG